MYLFFETLKNTGGNLCATLKDKGVEIEEQTTGESQIMHLQTLASASEFVFVHVHHSHMCKLGRGWNQNFKVPRICWDVDFHIIAVVLWAHCKRYSRFCGEFEGDREVEGVRGQLTRDEDLTRFCGRRTMIIQNNFNYFTLSVV